MTNTNDSYLLPLFEYMSKTYNITLVESEMHDLIHVVQSLNICQEILEDTKLRNKATDINKDFLK